MGAYCNKMGGGCQGVERRLLPCFVVAAIHVTGKVPPQEDPLSVDINTRLDTRAHCDIREMRAPSRPRCNPLSLYFV